MKKLTALLIISFFLLPVSSITTSADFNHIEKTVSTAPGEIISVSCSKPYPTLGQPVLLLITLAGHAKGRFNETLIITDEFYGFVMTDGEQKLISGELIEHQQNVTIGILPTYTKKIAWYPTVVGTHRLRISTPSSSGKQLNMSIGFDVDGIITPSLGCPALIRKDLTDQLQITLSDERPDSEEPAQVTMVTLESIDGSGSYQLEEQIGSENTSIRTGPDTVEDDFIISYDTDAVPAGFYNLTVASTTANYSWPHAVQLLDTAPANYTVVQLSDIHIGKYVNIANKKKELTSLFTAINQGIHPAFVILSGDSVDWYNTNSKRNVYIDLQEAILSSDVPVFIIPGNHERYGNSLLFLYYPFTNLTPYHQFLNPISDYSLQYGDSNFIFLDSGYDYSRWEIQPQIWNTTPEGSGLTNTQMYLLDQYWGNHQKNQIITMHHPAVNDKNDTAPGALPNALPSGNDECIAFNRGAFITYCIKNNVSLVLTGHTHENLLLTSLGKPVTNASAWPIFIQTDSATMSKQNNGGRLIQIQDGMVVSYEYLPIH